AVEGRHPGTGHAAALGDDLVAPGAVDGEETEAARHAASLRMRLRHRRPAAEGGDVTHERVDLLLRERRALAPRLLVRVAQRHVAGAEVEVGGARTHAAERRSEPAHVEDAPRPALRQHPAPADAVAGRALLGVETRAALGARSGR